MPQRRAWLCTLLVVAACTAGPHGPHAARDGGPGGTVSLVPAASWTVRGGRPGKIEGYADHVSVLPGQPVRLYVSTSASSYRVTAFRLGWYGRSQAARVWRSGPLPGRLQPPAAWVAATRTAWAPWRASTTVQTRGWPAGDYVFRLEASTGAQQYVPLTVRSSSAYGALVVVNAVTTWQAYNTWGGASLYQGRNGTRSTRSYAVSFDRPYAQWFANGAADLLGNELPLVALAERLHLRLAYATDVDLDENPRLLQGAVGMVSLGHDEYWSWAMRQHVMAARDRGMNIAFLGANAVFRHIRFASTALGRDRLEIDYKGAPADPMIGVRPDDVTVDWRSPPRPRPESVLTGDFYDCNPVHADMVVADPRSWLLQGIVRPGERLRGLVGSEYDRVSATSPTPRPIQVLFHSPVRCRGHATFSDATYYTTPSGAGVFDSGTSSWECALAVGVCADGRSDARAHQVVTAVTTRLLLAMAKGPLAWAHPARDDLASYGLHPPGVGRG